MGNGNLDPELAKFLTELRAQMGRIEERLRPTPTTLTYAKAAERLGVSTLTVRQMVRAGQIRTSTIGKRLKISLAEIERVETPDVERPKVEQRQRAARFVPPVRTPPPPKRS
jgi:excisionase family DNA binding protein